MVTVAPSIHHPVHNLERLKELRQEINHIDFELLQVLHKRKEIVSSIMDWKAENNYPIYDSSREESLIRNLQSKSIEHKLGLKDNFIDELYRIILKDSKRDYLEKYYASSQV